MSATLAPTVIEHDTREAWLETRRTGIGGSDAAAILGYSKYRSPLELYCDKIGLTESSAAETEHQEWGHRLEEPIARKYAEVSGRTITDLGDFTIHRSGEYPWMLATVDRLIEPKNLSPMGVLEIKTGAGWKYDDWAFEPPLGYQMQLQHNLIVTGHEWGAFAALFGGHQFLTYEVRLNVKFADLLIKEEHAFMQRVINRDPPPVDASESSARGLKALYPRPSGETINLPGVAADWGDEIEECKGRLKEITEKKRELENLLKESIGEATFGLLPSGIRYSYKLQTTPEHVVPETSFRVLRRHNK